MARHRIQVIRPFRFEYRLPAPMEVRFQVFQMNAADLLARCRAAGVLAQLGDPTALDALIEALEDPPPMRIFAAEAIHGICPEAPPFDPRAPDGERREARDELRRWWRRNRRRILEEWLRRRLREAGLLAGTPRSLTEALLAALEHPDPVLRFHAHRALVSRFGALVPYQYNWLPSLRAEAARAWREALARKSHPQPPRIGPHT